MDTFYGREDQLLDLKKSLVDQQGSVALVALQGIGGIGKTRLTLAFIEKYRDQFPGGIFWLNAEDENQRSEQFHEILKDLDPSTKSIDQFLQPQQTVPKALSLAISQYKPGQRRLWVLDNFPEVAPSGRVPNRDLWCPFRENTSFLITSRSQVVGVQPISVKPLDESSAIKLLTQNIDEISITHNQTKQIVEWVGYLPLAIVLINQSANNSAYSLTEWYNLSTNGHSLTNKTEQLMIELKDQLPENPQGIIATFQKSYNLLSRDAQEIACAISQFGPESISSKFFDFFIYDIKSMFPRGKRQQLALDLLRRRYFLSNSNEQYIGLMHRTLADFIRFNDKKRNIRSRDILKAFFSINLSKTQFQEHFPERRNFLSHAIFWLNRNENAQIIQNESDQTGSMFCLQVGMFLLNAKDFNLAYKYIDKAHAAFCIQLGEHHLLSLESLCHLGLISMHQGKLTHARELLLKSINGFKICMQKEKDGENEKEMQIFVQKIYRSQDLINQIENPICSANIPVCLSSL